MLELNNIGVLRDDWVLKDITLKFSSGSIYGVIGRSGVGKTTLLKVISGFIDASKGDTFFNDMKIEGPSNRLVPGYDEIQLVDQDFGLEPYHSVIENVREKILSRKKEEQDELIEEFLDLVELTEIKNRKAHLLSGGEKQRLSIARALACEPRVLLLDEPFVHLDQRLRRKIQHYLSELNQVQKMITVIVSHDGGELMGFVDEIIHLENREVVRIATAKEMYYRPNSHSEAELMGEVNSVQIDGEIIMFRPTEFELAGANLPIAFIRSLDLGLLTFFFFKTENNEEVTLSGNSDLSTLTAIKIRI